MCYVLGIEPSPNNGTWDLVTGMLRTYNKKVRGMTQSDRTFSIQSITTTLGSIIVFLIMLWFFLKKPCKNSMTSPVYVQLDTEEMKDA